VLPIPIVLCSLHLAGAGAYVTSGYQGKLTPLTLLVTFAVRGSPRSCGPFWTVKQASKKTVREKLVSNEAERTDKRIHIALPVRVTYWDKDKKPGLEMACTYDISPHGARITSLRCIQETGEIIAVERGRNKAFFRVVWIGEPNTDLSGQIGLQCVESERAVFENELHDLDEVYDPLLRSNAPHRLRSFGDRRDRRQRERIPVEGLADLLKGDNKGTQKAALKDLSEMGCLVTTKQMLLPGTDLKLVLNVANYILNLKGQVRHAALDLGVGIEFTEIRKGDKEMLQYLLQKLEEQRLEEVFQLDVQK
jgi:PilZ domain